MTVEIKCTKCGKVLCCVEDDILVITEFVCGECRRLEEYETEVSEKQR